MNPDNRHDANTCTEPDHDHDAPVVVLSGEALTPLEVQAVKSIISAHGLRWSPRPDAAMSYPPRAQSYPLLLPLSPWRVVLGRSVLLAIVLLWAGLAWQWHALHAGWANVSLEALQGMPGSMVLMAVWSLVLVLMWGVNQWTRYGRHRTVMAYPRWQVAQLPGLSSDAPVNLQVLPSATSSSDMVIHIMKNVAFEPIAGSAAAASTPATASPAQAYEAALVFFGQQLERALGWSTGRVQLLDGLHTDPHEPRTQWSALRVTDARTIPLEMLCDAIESACCGVQRQYQCTVE